jgi:outer membrane protein TolC
MLFFMKHIFYLLIYISWNSICFSQKDGETVMTFDSFISQIRNYHPIARQATIQAEKGDAYLLKSKGGFDPSISGDINQKYFDGSQYYSTANAALKIPTWFGLTVQGGYETNDGYRLNPQNSTPDNGLWYAGISVPLGKGLFIDQRRADLKQAKIYQQSSLIEQRRMMNELLYEAGKAYYELFKSYNKLLVYREMLETAKIRLDGIKQSVKFGDRAAIDTLEVGIQLQIRQFLLQQAELEYLNDRELVSIYLWADNFVPLELSENATPIPSKEVSPIPFEIKYISQLDSIKSTHPDLLINQFKIDFLKVDYRLNKENLKPRLDVKYNALSEPIGGDLLSQYSINNYNWGAQLSFPLFLRKERGILKLSELQIQEQENNQQFKAEFIEYKAKMTINNWKTSYNQALLYNQTVNDYRTLFAAEQELLFNGESSLFMVNSREMSYIDAEVKRLETLTENLKSKIIMEYVLGVLK